VLLAPAGRAVAGLALLVLLAALVAAAMAWLARPREQPVPERARPVGVPLDLATGNTSAAAGAGPLPAGPPASPAELVVHVTGEVRGPGVVRLPAGSRVQDAIDAAGGPTRRARTDSVNLARLLVDGEQVVVLGRGDPLPPPAGPGGGSTPGAAAPGTPVNLNTATLDQLDALPGIGPVLAQRILDWRAANGRFSAVDELGEVSGIGEATLGDVRALVTV
jgi:competence protein ComEA